MTGLMRLYRALIHLYPAGFQAEYGGLLERQLRDELADASGGLGRAGVWMHALWDASVSLPGQYGREIVQDLRHCWREHARRPLSTALALLTLALAMGAGTGVFSVVSAMLLRPLQFRDSERLVWSFTPTLFASRTALEDWVNKSGYATDAALFSTDEANLILRTASLRVRVAMTSGNFFTLLGAPIEIGRGFLNEDEPAGDRAVISHALWQQAFGGDPGVLGKNIQINHGSYQIVGVATAEFDYPQKAQVWVSSIFTPRALDRKGAIFYEMVQRLKPGVRFRAALARWDADVNRPERVHNDGLRMPFARLDDLLTDGRQGFSLLLASIGFLLLIACANVAHLVMARVLDRRKEIEIRAALGAHAGRLLQQLLVESIAMSLAAASLGILVAYATVRLLRGLHHRPPPRKITPCSTGACCCSQRRWLS